MKSDRYCQICDCQEAEFLHDISFASEDHIELPRLYRIVACAECGFVYDDFNANSDMFRKYYERATKYALDYSIGAGGENPVDLERWMLNFDFLHPYLNFSQRILDAGCGKGGWLKYLYKHGFKCLTGLDASEQCLTALADLPGVETICCNLQDMGLKDKFDLIMVTNVMEHVFDLSGTMEKIKNATHSNALIYLETPDASKYLDQKQSPFYYFDHEHINHFDVNSLSRLGERYGLSVQDVSFIKIELSPGFNSHQVGVLFRNCFGSKTPPAFSCRDTMRDYIELSKKKEKQLPRLYKGSFDTGFLWGVGAHCKRLLQDGYFDNLNIGGLLDLDPGKEHSTVCGHEIHLPDFILKYNCPENAVLITTVLYCRQVHEQLLKMNWQGKIIDCI